MKYCINCGAELTDEAKFCSSCGTPTNNSNGGRNDSSVTARTSDDGKGIVIDAPKDASVTISDTHETKAPDADGEFVVASWCPPRPQQSAYPEEHSQSIYKADVPETRKAIRSEKIVEPKDTVVEEEKFESENNNERGWMSLLVSNLWVFIKVLLIVVGTVLTIVIVKDIMSGSSSPQDTPSDQQEVLMQQQPAANDDNEPSAPAKPNHPTVQKEDDITIIGEEEESNNGIGHLDDMPLHDKIEYMEGLLERSEDALNKELAKGNAADQSYIRDLRKSIAEIRQALSEIRQ